MGIKLLFSNVGDRPLKTKGTLQELLVTDEKLDSKQWGATIDKKKEGSEVVFKIMPAADAIIGRYKVGKVAEKSK